METRLRNLTHSRVTNLGKGRINHIDFAIVYLMQHGPTAVGVCDRAHADALGKSPGYRYFSWCLFSPEFGYMSRSYDDTRSAIKCPCYGFGTSTKSYFYRVKRGVVALNVNGYMRVKDLLLAGKISLNDLNPPYSEVTK